MTVIKSGSAYFSQFSEDRLLDRMFSGKSTGYCVEVGANDGVTGSTTLYFEAKGWNCLLIEPNPALCHRLRSERSAKVVESAASNEEGEVSLYVAEGAPGAHAVSTMEGSEEEALRQISSHGFRGREIRVKTRTLDSIFESANITFGIDFITIDVEGHELPVLEGLSLRKWRPSVLIVEDNTWCKDLAVRDYLREYEYTPIRRTGVNDWYVQKSGSAIVNLTNAATYRLTVPIENIKFLYLARVKIFIRGLPGVMWLWSRWKARRARSANAK
jgi:FkbM family methyltransferase